MKENTNYIVNPLRFIAILVVFVMAFTLTIPVLSGTANVYAAPKTTDGKSAFFKPYVNADSVMGRSDKKVLFLLEKGQSYSFKYGQTVSINTNIASSYFKKIKWTIEDKSIASGKADYSSGSVKFNIKPKKTGKTTLTGSVKAHGKNFKVTIPVTVASVKPQSKTIYLKPGESTKLQFVYKGGISGNSQTSGLFDGEDEIVKNGQYKISAKQNGTKVIGYNVDGWNKKTKPGADIIKGTVKVVVDDKIVRATKITLPKGKSVKKGKSITLKPTFATAKTKTAQKEDLKWTVKNGSGKAKIDQSGKITGTKKGKVTVTGKSLITGKSAKCTVTIK